MALIECKECGRQVSELAYACPNCGYPINSSSEGPGRLQWAGQRYSNVRVYHKLMEYGLPVNLLGYEYIQFAVASCLENPVMVHAVTTLLYPAVANAFHTNSQKVERAMRYVLEAAWASGNQKLHKAFPPNANGRHRRPSNGAFIAIVVKELQMCSDEDKKF